MTGDAMSPEDGRVALCVARFYEELADLLETGAREALAEAGVEPADRFDVPGAFELPLAAKYAAASRCLSDRISFKALGTLTY